MSISTRSSSRQESRGEIGDSGETAHKEDGSLVFFDLAMDVLAKNELTSGTRNFTRMFQTPSLAQHSIEENDRLLCPIRALSTDRRKRSRLFIPVLGTREAVSKNTIAAWMARITQRAYLHQHGGLQVLHRAPAHEVTAIASSWHFTHTMSLENVLRAAAWRTQVRLSHHYPEGRFP